MPACAANAPGCRSERWPFWCALGTVRCRSEVLPRRRGDPQAAFEGLRERDCPETVVELACEGLKRGAEFLTPFVVLLWREARRSARHVESDDLPGDRGRPPCFVGSIGTTTESGGVKSSGTESAGAPAEAAIAPAFDGPAFDGPAFDGLSGCVILDRNVTRPPVAVVARGGPYFEPWHMQRPVKRSMQIPPAFICVPKRLESE